MSRADPRFDAVDSLRGLAALSIFAFHLTLQPGFLPPAALQPYAANLTCGVSVFFVLSGFVIYRPFARRRLAGEPAPSLRRYAARRVARIAPAYWVALAVIAVWLGLGDGGWLRYAAFLQVYDRGTSVGGIGQAWSICVEVTFYAAVAGLAVLLARRRPRSRAAFLRGELALLGAIALASLLWKLAPWFEVPVFGRYPAPATVTLPAYADQLALGMALAVVSVWAAAGRVRARRRPAVWIAWPLAGAAFVAAGALTDAGAADGRVGYAARHVLLGLVGVGLLLPAVAGPDGRLRALLRHPVLRWGGTVSYGFYLWHLVVLRSLSDGGWAARAGRPTYAVVAFAGALALAAASWYLVERPALRLAARRGAPDRAAVRPAGDRVEATR